MPAHNNVYDVHRQQKLATPHNQNRCALIRNPHCRKHIALALAQPLVTDLISNT